MATLYAAEPSPPWPLLSGDLPDLNVWLALVVEEHPHHARARAYWDETAPLRAIGQQLFFCRATMLGVIRLLSQPKVMGEGVLGLPEAHGIYRQLRETPGVGFCTDQEGADTLLAAWIGAGSAALPARLWPDAWLAAVAESAGLRLVSFDADFQRFPLTRVLRLSL